MRPACLFLLLLPSLARAADPLAAAHASKDSGHVLVVTRVESAIENLNKGTVDVFSTRREYRCPTGELVLESTCSPCTMKIERFGERPPNVWTYESSWSADDEASHREAAEQLKHFQKYFELGHASGSERGGRRFTFYEYTGRLKPPPPPAAAVRVRFFVGGKEATAALIPVGATEVEVEARAQSRGEDGGLEEMPQAQISFAASCGAARTLGAGRAMLSIPSGVERCAFKATAEPGGASETVGVRRELTLEITYEGQAADEIVLEGTNVVDLEFVAEAKGAKVAIEPEWKAEGGALEVGKGGGRARFRLEKGAASGAVELLDRKSGAADRVSVRRKKSGP